MEKYFTLPLLHQRLITGIANDVLPFIVLKDQLVALRDRIIAEDEYQTSLAFKAGLESPKIHSQLIKTFDALGIAYSGDLSEKVIEVLSDAVSENDTDEAAAEMFVSIMEGKPNLLRSQAIYDHCHEKLIGSTLKAKYTRLRKKHGYM